MDGHEAGVKTRNGKEGTAKGKELKGGSRVKNAYWNINRLMLIFIRSPMAAMVEMREDPP
jgi:hypothetical protein